MQPIQGGATPQSNDVIRFTPAVRADATRIAALVNSAYRGEASRRGWTTEADFLDGQRTDAAVIAEIIAQRDQWIVIGEHDGAIVGSMHLEKSAGGICYLGMFAIRPDLQARGLGKRFMAHAERFARERLGCARMRMQVITLRTELIAWYERRGYRHTGERGRFPYGDERFGIPLRADLEFEVLEKPL